MKTFFNWLGKGGGVALVPVAQSDLVIDMRFSADELEAGLVGNLSGKDKARLKTLLYAGADEINRLQRVVDSYEAQADACKPSGDFVG